MLRSHNTDISSSILTARYHFSPRRRFYSNLIFSTTKTSARYFCPTKISTDFHKAPTSNFTESRRMGSTLIHGAIRTDGHDQGNRSFFATVRTRLKTRVQDKHKLRRPSPHNIRIAKLYETFHTVWLFRHSVCILWLSTCKRARVCFKRASFNCCSLQI